MWNPVAQCEVTVWVLVCPDTVNASVAVVVRALSGVTPRVAKRPLPSAVASSGW
ncbi:hypothetical protein [Candidatus Poriferisodalis sp.]|uniref:hypothetical protein n=1 Tax=Candidatus Poriferisodalis sp. TaxID=3101277 RepID=UPI003AF5E252